MAGTIGRQKIDSLIVLPFSVFQLFLQQQQWVLNFLDALPLGSTDVEVDAISPDIDITLLLERPALPVLMLRASL